MSVSDKIIALPATFSQAILRGLTGKCPRCGEGKLFRKWLKPVDTCPACKQDWSLQSADDFPPYVAIFTTGHVAAPLLIGLTLHYELDPLVAASFVMPLALAASLGILQPSKGAIIAVQWWHGMSGFICERLPTPDGTDKA